PSGARGAHSPARVATRRKNGRPERRLVAGRPEAADLGGVESLRDRTVPDRGGSIRRDLDLGELALLAALSRWLVALPAREPRRADASHAAGGRQTASGGGSRRSMGLLSRGAPHGDSSPKEGEPDDSPLRQQSSRHAPTAARGLGRQPEDHARSAPSR